MPCRPQGIGKASISKRTVGGGSSGEKWKVEGGSIWRLPPSTAISTKLLAKTKMAKTVKLHLAQEPPPTVLLLVRQNQLAELETCFFF